MVSSEGSFSGGRPEAMHCTPNRERGTSSTFLFHPMSAPQDRCSPHPSCPPPCLWSKWCGIETICPPEFLMDPPIPVQSQQSGAGCGHSAVARGGGLPASCVGSKYLHSPSSRVARWRGLDVLGYVKASPPGHIFNRLPLLEQIFFWFAFAVFSSLWNRRGHKADCSQPTWWIYFEYQTVW